MYHEQSRLDRDNFIRIDRTNITGGDAFAQLTNRLAKDYTNYFDFESVMLYGSYSNAQDRSRPTMTKLDGSTFEGYLARSGLSVGDIATLNAMYPKGGNRPPEDPPVDTSPTLPDVPGNWAESEIRYMLTNNLMAGYVDNTFKPTREVTRAEFATMIRSVLNPSVSADPAVANRSFSDIAPHWVYSNILAVARAGFLSGYPDGTFKPNNNISRQEMIVSLANGLGLPGASPSVLSIFSDRSDILSWAASPVANATAQGFIANYPDRSQLRPTANATRADVTVILYQVLRYQGRAPALANEYLVRP